jgi:hypothetical protein
MIPPRRLSGENCGNGVSYRVAVCRKRLRVSRTTPRVQANPGDGLELIPTPRLDGYSLNSPSVANELIARHLLSRQTELAANPGGHALIEVAVEAVVEVGLTAQEKAEDT